MILSSRESPSSVARSTFAIDMSSDEKAVVDHSGPSTSPTKPSSHRNFAVPEHSYRLGGGAEPGAAARGGRRRSAAADRRGRGDREDADAGAPGGGADRARRRSAAHPAADVLAAGGAGDDPARAALVAARARAAASRATTPTRRRRAALGGDVPRGREPPAAPARGRGRARSGVHAARSRGRRRSARSPAPRARAGAHRPALPAQGDLPGDLLAASSTRRSRCAPACERAFPGASNGRSRCARCSPPTSTPRRRAPCSTTTICCSTGST